MDPVVEMLFGVLYHSLLREQAMGDSTLSRCSVLLLAGGRGQRMGGKDKGLVTWHERPLISWLHDVVRPLTDDLIVSCNRNERQYAAYADQLVKDGEQGFQGPLAGIRAGLTVARHPWLMVLPCDAPTVDRPLLLSLFRASLDAPGQPIMVRLGQQWEPLFCVIPTELAPAIQSAWSTGERSIREILLRLTAASLDLAADDPRFINLNSPELLTAHSPPGGT